MTGELTEVLTFLQDNGVGESRYSKKNQSITFLNGRLHSKFYSEITAQTKDR